MLKYRKDFVYESGRGMVHVPTNEAFACKGVNKILTESMPKIEHSKARRKAGLQMHADIEDAIAKADFTNLPQLQTFFDSKSTIAWHSEVFVHLQGNKRDCIGFIDAVGLNELDGSILIIDWKTKQNSHFNRTTMLNNILQIAAYSYMFAKYYGIDEPKRLQPSIVYLFESGEPLEVQLLTQQQFFASVHTFLSKLG